MKWERERRFDLSYRVKITLNADASIRTAGGFTRTQHLEFSEKMEIIAEISWMRVHHPQYGSATRTGDLAKFQKIKVYTEKPLSAAAPIRSAGRPPALGFEITIQKKSEASADALDSSAGQSIRSAGQSTRSAGQSTRTQHLVN